MPPCKRYEEVLNPKPETLVPCQVTRSLGTARTSIHHDATTPIAGVVFLVWQLLFIRAASCIKVEHVLETSYLRLQNGRTSLWDLQCHLTHAPGNMKATAIKEHEGLRQGLSKCTFFFP